MSREEQKRINETYGNEQLTDEQRLFNASIYRDWKRQSYYRPTLKGLAKMALYEWKHDKNIRNSILGTMKLVEIPKVFDKCPVPVLTMEAARELTWNTDKAEKLQNVFPGSRLVMFEHAGHAMFGDEPENFFSSLEEFVRKGQKVYKSASDLHDSAPEGFCGVDILLGNPKGR